MGDCLGESGWGCLGESGGLASSCGENVDEFASEAVGDSCARQSCCGEDIIEELASEAEGDMGPPGSESKSESSIPRSRSLTLVTGNAVLDGRTHCALSPVTVVDRVTPAMEVLPGPDVEGAGAGGGGSAIRSDRKED